VSLIWILDILVADTVLAPEKQQARTLNPSANNPSAPLQVDYDPTSSPLALSNDALPDSTLSPVTTMTPATVLSETHKRKNRHQKSKKPCKKQKKFITSDNEEDGEGSPTDSDSAHSSNGDHDNNDNNDGEPVPHSMRWHSTRDSASVAGVP